MKCIMNTFNFRNAWPIRGRMAAQLQENRPIGLQRAISVAGPSTWNGLPLSLRLIDSHRHFCKHLECVVEAGVRLTADYTVALLLLLLLCTVDRWSYSFVVQRRIIINSLMMMMMMMMMCLHC